MEDPCLRERNTWLCFKCCPKSPRERIRPWQKELEGDEESAEQLFSVEKGKIQMKVSAPSNVC
jgi:hypothetical protein